MTTALDPKDQVRLSHMALPSRLAQYVSKDLFGFEWIPAPHIAYMEQRVLANVLEPKKTFISISMPPRHGKSLYCSAALAAWFLGMYPEKNVILVTYSEDYALRYGRLVRDILARYGKELFGRSVSRGANSVTDWQMERSLGGMLSVGVGGGITGRGGDLIIIDDLIKNQQEARSNATKLFHKTEYDASIRTRLETGGTIVAVATRWAMDDLPGRWREMDEAGDQWEFVDFPCIAECPKDEDPEIWRDELGRKDGDALWPARLPVEEAMKTKASIEELVWAAMYQQDPSTLQTAMFPADKWGTYPWYQRDEVMKKCVRFVRAWDLAASEESGDWTVGVWMGMGWDGRIYVLDVDRFRSGPTEVENRVLKRAEEDGVKTHVIIEQEKAGSGKTVVAHYARVLMNRVVEAIPVTGSKDERAMIYAGKMGAGLVLIPDEIHWRKEWVDEHKLFGRIKTDDQVDAAAHGFNYLADQGGVARIWSPAEIPLNFHAEEQLRALLERGVVVRR